MDYEPGLSDRTTQQFKSPTLRGKNRLDICIILTWFFSKEAIWQRSIAINTTRKANINGKAVLGVNSQSINVDRSWRLTKVSCGYELSCRESEFDDVVLHAADGCRSWQEIPT